MLHDDDVRRIALAVTEQLVETGTGCLTPDELTYLRVWMRARARRAETLERIIERVGGWAILVVLGAIGAAVWAYFKGQIQLPPPK